MSDPQVRFECENPECIRDYRHLRDAARNTGSIICPCGYALRRYPLRGIWGDEANLRMSNTRGEKMNDRNAPEVISDLHMLIMHRNPVMPNPSPRGHNDVTGRSYTGVRAACASALAEEEAIARLCQDWWAEFRRVVPPMVPVWWRTLPQFLRPGDGVPVMGSSTPESGQYRIVARLDWLKSADSDRTSYTFPSWVINPTGQVEIADFGWALGRLREGHKVARAGWNGKDMFLYLVEGSRFTVNREPLLSILGEGTAVDYLPHIDMKTATGEFVPWLASQTDMLATDWEVVA